MPDLLRDCSPRPHPLAALRRRVESLAADHSPAFPVEAPLGDLVAIFGAWRRADEEAAQANEAYRELQRELRRDG